MRFDEVLTRADGPAVAQELAALRRPGRMVIDGVHQEAPREHWQFRLDIDEARQRWTLDRSEQPTVSYRDGVLHDEDGQFEDSFEHSTVAGTAVRVAVPELMLRWGRGPESFHPVLIQHAGTPSWSRSSTVGTRRSARPWWSMSATASPAGPWSTERPRSSPACGPPSPTTSCHRRPSSP
ncbi:hypothetical protein [Curtobacterium sp. SORGH_AS_0776]|uniref:hypothetical protein n=1 Tax=Curtobacterium sp. SORGH_AS_0776 TaxID=3041798 RepID=UPI002859D7CE|nr:hypothetical protein [Curtobacterium sp. SORGH_AS_0776]MDR6171130.1 hypothetical protein [Curtobacterium sp. SORGH_AS_0776]